MVVGSCFCEKIRVEYNGEPITSALCHCHDCRKLTGTLFTYSFLVHWADLKISGNPKEVAKRADSGNLVKNYFCSDCGTPIYGHKIQPSGIPEEITVLRAGIFDDIEFLDRHKPKIEVYNVGRVKWVCPLEGAGQFVGMPPLP